MEKKKKQLLFSLSKDKGDFVVEVFRCGGNGGQNVNKISSGVRIKHPASGAVVECTEQRTQGQNKKLAFERLCKTPKFLAWHKLRTAYAIKGIHDFEKEIERKVDEQMKESNLLIEFYEPNEGKKNAHKSK